jgi:heme/copper-type cytochrome/quinol oxidase subunit 2
MRYLAQLIIPILIFIAVALFANRRRRRRAEHGDAGQASESAAFIAILTVGAIAAIGIAWATQSLWETG